MPGSMFQGGSSGPPPGTDSNIENYQRPNEYVPYPVDDYNMIEPLTKENLPPNPVIGPVVEPSVGSSSGEMQSSLIPLNSLFASIIFIAKGIFLIP